MEGGGGGIVGKGNPGPLFPSNTPRAKPKSLLEAISDIEKLSAVERTGMPIPTHFLLLNEKFAYFDVGLKAAWADMLVNLIFTPISVGVFDRVVPIFGTYNPTVVDQLFSLLIGLSYTLGINILLAFNLGGCYFGKVCRNAIWQLYGGFVVGSFLKMLLIFFIFHFLYWRITPELISQLLTSLYLVVHGIFTAAQWDKVFYWFVDMRNLLFKSGIFIVVSTVICLALPFASFLLGSRRANYEDEVRRKYDAI